MIIIRHDVGDQLYVAFGGRIIHAEVYSIERHKALGGQKSVITEYSLKDITTQKLISGRYTDSDVFDTEEQLIQSLIHS